MAETIESLLAEGRTFPPPDGFKKHARVVGTDVYDEADVDFEGFWARQAAELLDWSRTGTRSSTGISRSRSGSSAAG